MAADPSVTHVEKLLAGMARWRASDLFLAEGKQPAVRIDGAVARLDTEPTTGDQLRLFVERGLNAAQRQRLEAEGDLDLGHSLADGSRYRLNLARQRGALALVARAVPSGELSLAELGLPAVINTFADLPRGLVLVTGATGSGKSTTLAAMIHHINTSRRAHIVTIEDPIEFVHADKRSHVTQREVGGDTLSFSAALKHALRQSPDVILVGELRDAESCQVALAAALTGHLILASLHTSDATQTLQRLLSFFPEDLRPQVALDLSMSLQGVVSQRLLPRADGTGRVVALEALSMGPAAARLVQEQRIDELADAMQGSTDPGTFTLNRSLLELHRAGVITFEVAMAHSSNPDELALSAQGMATGVEALRERSDAAAPSGPDLKALLARAVDSGASDLHLTVGRPPILRVAGELRPVELPPLSALDMRRLLFSIINQRQRTLYELDRELDFALALESGQRFRVNAYFQKGNMAASLRAIPSQVPDAKALRLPESLLSLVDRSQGLLLVVGPTGSGKTTTLACLVDRINSSRACRIITVEDPIEYTHTSHVASVDQREVFADTKSFATALKYVLRQDPDVILIGEMRDFETVSAALTAAETGHLVLATLHTNDAAQSIDRMIDVFPPHQQAQARTQVAAALLGVFSQRLLPRRGGSGRVPAFEVMMANAAIRTLIREDKMHQAQSMMEAGRRDGMVTMDYALKELVSEGLVSAAEAQRYQRTPKV